MIKIDIHKKVNKLQEKYALSTKVRDDILKLCLQIEKEKLK